MKSMALDIFMNFWLKVKESDQWKVMEQTVEGSEWHREENVAVHTKMCIEHYINEVARERNERQVALTLITLLFHDFGKPEAEETVDRKDGSGSYHRYAGHEPKSANEFLSFMMSHRELTESFFKQGFGWEDVRKIKWMIEHHLPFGLKNPTKRANMKRAMIEVLGDDAQCFYDQLWSDCNGRISDNHEEKRQNVLDWIAEWKDQVPAPIKVPKVGAPTMYVMVGPAGAGKSTWVDSNFSSQRLEVVSEDVYRMEFAEANMASEVYDEWIIKDSKAQYAQAWQFCFDSNGAYDKYAKEKLKSAVESGYDLVLDRTNQTRKSRGPWIQAAKQAGYRIEAVEFFVSEDMSHARQKSREDKDVPPHRTHRIYMAFEVPWDGVEVDDHMIIAQF